MIKVLAGDFGSDKYAVLQTNLTGSKLTGVMVSHGLFKAETIPANEIASVDVVTDTNKVTLLGAVGGGLVGTLLAGPIGTLVGGLLGGRTSAVTLLVKTHSGKQLLCAGSPKDLTLLMAAAVNSAGQSA